MHDVYLLLGGNLGNTAQILSGCRKALIDNVGPIIAQSSIHKTTPWGFQSINDFQNQVIYLKTQLDPLPLLDVIQEIERNFGRIREHVDTVSYHDRTLDIDILFYDQIRIQTDRLTIPHPLLHLRQFTLEPLAEIAPLLIHPVYQKSIKELMTENRE